MRASQAGPRGVSIAGEVRSPRATIRDVAALAGVSRGTVSRVLNNSPAVSPDTRRVVEDAIVRTRFVANATARSLNTRRTGTVALVVTEPQERVFEDPTFNLMVRELRRHAEQSDILMFVVLADTDLARERVVTRVQDGSLDGLLLLSTHGSDAIFDMIVRAKIPAVVCGEPLGMGTALPFVRLGDRRGARDGVEHLIEAGNRSILVVVGPEDTASSRNREAGARDACRRAAAVVELTVHRCSEYSVREGRDALSRALAERVPIDALFCGSDVLAAGALATLAEHSVSIPGDLRVVTFDDTAVASDHVPPLTSVALPFGACAGASLELLLASIEGRAATSVNLECKLVVRD